LKTRLDSAATDSRRDLTVELTLRYSPTNLTAHSWLSRFAAQPNTRLCAL
jgi:hypothetical protein